MHMDRLRACFETKTLQRFEAAQGGGGRFQNRKRIGEVLCGKSKMAERSHWWTDKGLRSRLLLSISFFLFLWLSTYLLISPSIVLFIWVIGQTALEKCDWGWKISSLGFHCFTVYPDCIIPRPYSKLGDFSFAWVTNLDAKCCTLLRKFLEWCVKPTAPPASCATLTSPVYSVAGLPKQILRRAMREQATKSSSFCSAL